MDTRQKIFSLVVNKLGLDPSEVTRESRFADDLGIDSLRSVELAMALEHEFGIEISDDVRESLLTFGELTDYVVGRVGG